MTFWKDENICKARGHIKLQVIQALPMDGRGTFFPPFSFLEPCEYPSFLCLNKSCLQSFRYTVKQFKIVRHQTKLNHFPPMFDLCRNKVVGFY